jgi:hypothetical protein
MLERFSISIAAATILATLGKLALLYHADVDAGKDWFVGPVEQPILCHLLLAVFLIFFRGKMMHDDGMFFCDLAKGGIFKSGTSWKLLIKIGLLLGYISWLLWAPAIYFLDDRYRFAGFLIASLSLSTFWLIIDILTRTTLEWRRAFWVIPNTFYIGFLVLLMQPSWASLATVALLIVLVIDWLVSDPFSGHV